MSARRNRAAPGWLPLVAWLLLASGCASRLPSSARPVLLTKLKANKILQVDDVQRRMIGGYDYMGVRASYEISWGFESVYYPVVILRKEHAKGDWSNAEIFLCSGDLERIFRWPEQEFLRAVVPR